MKKLILFFIVLLSSPAFSSTAEENYLNLEHHSWSSNPQYQIYREDPSQYVFESELDSYIYNNYGSTESMDYLNRGDADSYNGGSEFDRNY